jgi:hypothetical protein
MSEATPEDVQEQQAPLAGGTDTPEDELPVEAAEADASEDLGLATGDEAVPDEAPEADVAEQRLEVSFDEEDAPIG